MASPPLLEIACLKTIVSMDFTPSNVTMTVAPASVPSSFWSPTPCVSHASVPSLPSDALLSGLLLSALTCFSTVTVPKYVADSEAGPSTLLTSISLMVSQQAPSLSAVAMRRTPKTSFCPRSLKSTTCSRLLSSVLPSTSTHSRPLSVSLRTCSLPVRSVSLRWPPS